MMDGQNLMRFNVPVDVPLPVPILFRNVELDGVMVRGMTVEPVRIGPDCFRTFDSFCVVHPETLLPGAVCVGL